MQQISFPSGLMSVRHSYTFARHGCTTLAASTSPGIWDSVSRRLLCQRYCEPADGLVLAKPTCTLDGVVYVHPTSTAPPNTRSTGNNPCVTAKPGDTCLIVAGELSVSLSAFLLAANPAVNAECTNLLAGPAELRESTDSPSSHKEGVAMYMQVTTNPKNAMKYASRISDYSKIFQQYRVGGNACESLNRPKLPRRSARVYILETPFIV
jgi:hypothetical protein